MKASTTILALSALVASTSAKPISRMISVKMPAGAMANKMTSDSMVRREVEMGAAATTPAVPETPTGAAAAPEAVLESAKVNENPSPAQKDEAKVALDKLEEVKGTVSDAKGKIHAVMEMEGDVDMDALKTIVNDVNMKIVDIGSIGGILGGNAGIDPISAATGLATDVVNGVGGLLSNIFGGGRRRVPTSASGSIGIDGLLGSVDGLLGGGTGLNGGLRGAASGAGSAAGNVGGSLGLGFGGKPPGRNGGLIGLANGLTGGITEGIRGIANDLTGGLSETALDIADGFTGGLVRGNDRGQAGASGSLTGTIGRLPGGLTGGLTGNLGGLTGSIGGNIGGAAGQTGNSSGGDKTGSQPGKTGSQPGKTGSQPGRPRKETFNLSGLEGFDLEALGFGDVDVNNLTEAELREINEVLDLGIDVDALVASIRN
ncbi:hypothetical protein D7B24_000864 [Verticillium nonalfalfae]|uniref:Uncharacterized protein n=1 Tax=Verticillium nonalfalfae TaxID=1051616 RepID=A0A3M9Y1Y8_9PEZI|nr:uncharacterized protein D7B24_000864 [Verticillium nonalfalfae]RNJ54125.1 hypothetical protein D7B24_000864 [Verticillium nonalfalfae]